MVIISYSIQSLFALEGDGSLLMNLGCLATIGTVSPRNLTVIVWDNGAYQITGGQAAATARGTDLVTIARGAGIVSSVWIEDEADFAAVLPRLGAQAREWLRDSLECAHPGHAWIAALAAF